MSSQRKRDQPKHDGSFYSIHYSFNTMESSTPIQDVASRRPTTTISISLTALRPPPPAPRHAFSRLRYRSYLGSARMSNSQGNGGAEDVSAAEAGAAECPEVAALRSAARKTRTEQQSSAEHTGSQLHDRASSVDRRSPSPRAADRQRCSWKA